MEKKLNKIKVIVPFYNPGEFLDRCVSAVLTQDYENYEVIFVDDCSTDGSFQKVPSVVYKTDEKSNFIIDENNQPIIESIHPLLQKTKCLNIQALRANQRQTALPNIHNAIIRFCTDPEDIIILVDGDDSLLSKGVLSFINDFYNEHNCLMMYGSSKWTDGRPCCASAYSKFEFTNLRGAPFRVSHIRSFKAKLYHQIGIQDTEWNCMKDNNGQWYKMTYDVAMFLPMLEIAGYDKVKYNPKPLYLYNRENPISDDRVNQTLQWNIHAEILKKIVFKQVDFEKSKIL